MENHVFPPVQTFSELMDLEFEGTEEQKTTILDYVRDLKAGVLPEPMGPIPPIQEYIMAEVDRQRPIKLGMPVEPVKFPDYSRQYRETAYRELTGSQERSTQSTKKGARAGRAHGKNAPAKNAAGKNKRTH